MSKKLNKYQCIKDGFYIIENEGWNKFSFEKLSKKSKVDSKTIKIMFRNKIGFLKAFSLMIDEKVIDNLNFDEFKNNKVKDNLFELIMLRFEALNDYKVGLKNLLNDLKSSPCDLKNVTRNIFDSMDLFLDIAKGKDNYFFDFIKINIIFIIYSYIFNFWLDDKSKDMNITMAELDKWLSQAEIYSKKFNQFF